METPTPDLTQPTIHAALAAVMGEINHVGKDGWNDHQKFNFRGIDAVVNAVGPALRKHKVIVVPRLISVTYETVQTTNNKASTACRLVMSYVFYGPAGDELGVSVAGESWDTSDKATSKAMSVCFRTALLQSLALPTDEPDPDASTYERAEPQPDPVIEAKKRVKAAWELTRTFDPAALKEHYAATTGLSLDDATAADLNAYAVTFEQETP